MENIVRVGEVSHLGKKLRQQNRKIVLVGGCFDILHLGHITFLEKAKRVGDILVVFLESDQKVKELKGSKRPVHTQKERAQVLASIKFVDYVVLLPFLEKDEQYDELVLKLRPDVIAATSNSSDTHKERSAKKAGAKLKFVTKMIGNYSSSKLLLT